MTKSCFLLLFTCFATLFAEPQGQLELVAYLKRRGVVKTTEVEDVMRSVDRADFISPFTHPTTAYYDSPQPIGFGATISAPHIHAFALVLSTPQIRRSIWQKL